MARRLEGAGADFLVMACNAAHAFQRDIEAAVSVPFVSIIEETARATVERLPDVRKVGVLGSSGCLDSRLYQDAFARYGVEVVVPEGAERDLFMTLLYRIKAGDKGEEVSVAVQALAESLVGAGAQARRRVYGGAARARSGRAGGAARGLERRLGRTHGVLREAQL